MLCGLADMFPVKMPDQGKNGKETQHTEKKTGVVKQDILDLGAAGSKQLDGFIQYTEKKSHGQDMEQGKERDLLPVLEKQGDFDACQRKLQKMHALAYQDVRDTGIPDKQGENGLQDRQSDIPAQMGGILLGKQGISHDKEQCYRQQDMDGNRFFLHKYL